jgi:hypothetical protein
MARFYTVQETALILGFSTNSIYKFLDQGRLKSTRGNSKQGRFRIPHTSIEDFLDTKLSETAVASALAASKRNKTQPPVNSPPPAAAPTYQAPPRHILTDKHQEVAHLEPLAGSAEPPTTPLGLTTTRLLILLILILSIILVVTAPAVSPLHQLLWLVTLAIVILLAYQSGGSESG